MIGAHRAGVTPVPIPNTEVKPSIGEDTALRESSTVPNYQRAIRKDGSLAFLGMTLTLRLSYRSVPQQFAANTESSLIQKTGTFTTFLY